MAAEIWILILAIAGFLVSGFIYYKKSRKEKLVCVIGEDCDKVIRSKYGVTFGIDNTILGMLYYVAVAVGAVLLLSGIAVVLGFSVLDVLIVAGLFAALFSLYLAFIQIFIIKEYCEYCLTSAAITIAIFLVEVLV